MLTKDDNAKKITILGSTGTIGKNTINVIQNSKILYSIKNLIAKNNYELLASQALELNPEKVIIANDVHYLALKNILSHTDIKVEAGFDAVIAAAAESVDMVMVGIEGIQVLYPLEAAIKAGNNIALSNKESIVCAGPQILKLAKNHKVKILPVDSEHNAIFQLLEGFNKDSYALNKITLTASGGPFLQYNLEDLKNVTKEQALKHPNWVMGPKITIDSATMVNKALEYIEAHYLFNLDENAINVMIHPESIIHGMIEFKDGSTIAHMGCSDMRIPISYAISYPERDISAKVPILNLADLGYLSFFSVDNKRFPVMNIVKNIVKNKNQRDAIIFNAANEIAVELFLKDKIKFIEIVKIIEDTMETQFTNEVIVSNISSIVELDFLVKEKIKAKYLKLACC